MNICSSDNSYRQDAENAKVNQNAKSQGVNGAKVFKNLCVLGGSWRFKLSPGAAQKALSLPGAACSCSHPYAKMRPSIAAEGGCVEKIYKYKSLVILLILGCLCNPGCAASFSPAPTLASDEERIKAAIQAYFSLRYQAFQANQPLVLDAVVDQTDAKTREWLKLEADRREVEMFIHSEYDTQILAYHFDLNFTGIEISQNTAVVQLLEGNEITYANNPEQPAALAGLEHEISLLKVDGQWLITNDVYSDEIIRLLRISTKEKLIETVKVNAGHEK